MNKVICVNKFSYLFRWHPAEINYSVIPIVFLLLFFLTAFPVRMLVKVAWTLLVKVAWTRLAPVLT
jgi:hypothetical protein